MKFQQYVSRFAAAVLVGMGFLGLTASPAQAQAPLVNFTTSGSPGDWTLDFSVTNDLGVNFLDIYFFGVQLGARDITGSPASFDPNTWPSWNNTPYGGSATVYNNNWIDFTFNSLQNGQTLSGFKTHSTALAAPTDVKWFAYAYGANYTGNSPYFNQSGNPGFESIANASGTNPAVPEPGNMALLFGAMTMGAGFVIRRRR